MRRLHGASSYFWSSRIMQQTTPTTLTIANVELLLLHQAAIYVPDRDVLLVADLHLGKAEHFRKHGIGLPGDVTSTDVDRLASLLAMYLPTRVVILGDLFHSVYNPSWEHFMSVVHTFEAIDFRLVVGNHDILDDADYEGLTLSYQYSIGDIVCTHEPLDVSMENKYNLCGHIHPGVRLRGKGRQYLRLPCFYFGAQMGVMPAFGSFTGLHTVNPVVGDKVFVIGDDVVSRVH